MVPEVLEDARNIDLYDADVTPDEDATPYDNTWSEIEKPRIGDIFENVKRKPTFTVMVIAIQGSNIYLSGGYKIKKEELANEEEWIYINHVSEQLL